VENSCKHKSRIKQKTTQEMKKAVMLLRTFPAAVGYLGAGAGAGGGGSSSSRC
jgi:hypothetical protein